MDTCPMRKHRSDPSRILYRLESELTWHVSRVCGSTPCSPCTASEQREKSTVRCRRALSEAEQARRRAGEQTRQDAAERHDRMQQQEEERMGRAREVRRATHLSRSTAQRVKEERHHQRQLAVLDAERQAAESIKEARRATAEHKRQSRDRIFHDRCVCAAGPDLASGVWPLTPSAWLPECPRLSPLLEPADQRKTPRHATPTRRYASATQADALEHSPFFNFWLMDDVAVATIQSANRQLLERLDDAQPRTDDRIDEDATAEARALAAAAAHERRRAETARIQRENELMRQRLQQATTTLRTGDGGGSGHGGSSGSLGGPSVLEAAGIFSAVLRASLGESNADVKL